MCSLTPDNAEIGVATVSGLSGVSSENSKYLKFTLRSTQKKKLNDAYLLCLVCGVLGAHRYYLGDKVLGIIYTLTLGLFFTGWITDLLRMPLLVRRANAEIKRSEALGDHRIKLYRQVHLDEAYSLWFPFGVFGKLCTKFNSY